MYRNLIVEADSNKADKTASNQLKLMMLRVSEASMKEFGLLYFSKTVFAYKSSRTTGMCIIFQDLVSEPASHI